MATVLPTLPYHPTFTGPRIRTRAMPAALRNEHESLGHLSPSLANVQSIPPTIGITVRRTKQLNSIALIREQREQRRQEVAFNARPLVPCGIPLCPLPKDQLAYKRRNGKFSLQIVGHPDFGLPFGQDRLIPNWVATLALRPGTSLPESAHTVT
ncbi:MAG: hypothetical protein M1404_01885 [Acidobacteria bacterium]|nr:hypothetical protein [Acidobacteriota bacterium]